MKVLHRNILTTVAAVTIAITASTSFAYGGNKMNTERADPSVRLNYIFTQLDLTEAQQTEVLAILDTIRTEHREAMQALRDQQQTRPTREEMDAFRQANAAQWKQTVTDQLNTVLSPEVTAELTDYLDAHRGMGPANRPDRGERGGSCNKGARGNAQQTALNK